jgi:hypothetical protein
MAVCMGQVFHSPVRMNLGYAIRSRPAKTKIRLLLSRVIEMTEVTCTWFT